MSNIKLNFNKALLLINGQPDEVAKLSNVLGGVLGAEFSEDEHRIGKIFSWINSLSEGKEISVDNADFKALKDLVVKSKNLNAFFKAQILNVLDESKEAAGKPAKKASKSSDSEGPGGQPHPKDNPFHP